MMWSGRPAENARVACVAPTATVRWMAARLRAMNRPIRGAETRDARRESLYAEEASCFDLEENIFGLVVFI